VVQLTKVTCIYSEIEDRIRMSAIMKEGEPVVFWLTQRLCCRLVPTLTAHLEQSVLRSTLLDTGLLLSCQQRDAEWHHKPSEPVNYREASLLILPEKVDLSFSAESVGVSLPLNNEEDALMKMSLQELRQWLAIVYRQFQNACWPMDVWPDWFTLAESGRN